MRLSPTIALAVGALGSGAANVAWTWELGPVRIVGGLFATALVPISLHLWPQVPVTGKATRVVRALVMTYICLAAAIVNLAHAVQVLTSPSGHDNLNSALAVHDVPAVGSATSDPAGENIVLAVLLITAIEAVMVMATLARRTPAARTATPEQQVALLVAVAQLAAAAQAKPAPKQRPRRSVSAPPPAPPVAAPNPDESDPSVTSIDQPRRRDVGLAHARANWPVTSGEIRKAIEKVTGMPVSRGESDRIRSMVKAEMETVS